MSTETATKVINLRAPARKQSLIDRAAKVTGKNRSQFIIDASFERAREVLADQVAFELDGKAWKEFQSALDAPLDPESTAALSDLLNSKSPWE